MNIKQQIQNYKDLNIHNNLIKYLHQIIMFIYY